MYVQKYAIIREDWEELLKFLPSYMNPWCYIISTGTTASNYITKKKTFWI